MSALMLVIANQTLLELMENPLKLFAAFLQKAATAVCALQVAAALTVMVTNIKPPTQPLMPLRKSIPMNINIPLHQSDFRLLLLRLELAPAQSVQAREA